MNKSARSALRTAHPDLRVLVTALLAAAYAACAHHVVTGGSARAQPTQTPHRFLVAAPEAAPLFLVRAADEHAAGARTDAAQLEIRVHPGRPDTALPAALRAAYHALRAGDHDAAQRLYGELEHSEPRNIDALLGLAALAMQRGDAEAAAQYYLRILRLDPRHTLAQATLLAAFGQADAQAAEVRLKTLAERDPSAPLYQMLGNLYADQSRWHEAQRAYFRAYQLAPGNGDHVYNLAVGLDHIGERRLALNFYRRAVTLSRSAGAANFGLDAAAERIDRLSSADH